MSVKVNKKFPHALLTKYVYYANDCALFNRKFIEYIVNNESEDREICIETWKRLVDHLETTLKYLREDNIMNKLFNDG